MGEKKDNRDRASGLNRPETEAQGNDLDGTDIVREMADRVAGANRFRSGDFGANSAMMNDAVREALAGPAREIADQIARANRFRYAGFGANSAMMNDAVREALTGPAKEIADQIAWQNKFFASTSNYAVLNDAVREALSASAKEIADQISASSYVWLQNYSGQAVEPTIYSDVAKILAADKFESAGSDYEPVSLELLNGAQRPAPSIMFERHEITGKSLSGLLSDFDRLTRRFQPRTITWRGQADADWGLHSTLYREVNRHNESRAAEANHRITPAIPTELDVVAAERFLLDELSNQWRLGNAPAIEVLARMQDRGVPTHLLDVTRNPILALWFAVSDPGEADARVFAVAHRPVPVGEKIQARSLAREIWSDQHPFWFDFESARRRVVGAWGTGTRLREIAPPEYDRRILAQNAVFLLDGLPSLTESVLAQFNRVAGAEWTAIDVAASMSVVLAPADPKTSGETLDSPFSLVFSYRIPGKLKPEILRSLKRTYGLGWETIYPDMEGIRTHLDSDPDWYSYAKMEM